MTAAGAPDAAERQVVAVIGAGMVGRAWTTLLARAGLEVRLYDDQPGATTAALEEIAAMLGLFDSAHLLGDLDRDTALTLVQPTTSLAAAVDGVVHVQECVPEVLATKRAVTAAIAELAPDDAVLASSTSALAPSTFSGDVRGRHRCLVAHPINPVHLHTLVEVVPAPWTAADVVRRTVELMRRVGMQPVCLDHEVDGFLVNRLQGALLQEAFRLTADGVATAADVDTAVRAGLAPRWSLMGPFETIDLNAPGGIADYVERYEPMYQRLAEQQTETADWSATLRAGLLDQRREALPQNRLADRRAWRDRRLLELLMNAERQDP